MQLRDLTPRDAFTAVWVQVRQQILKALQVITKFFDLVLLGQTAASDVRGGTKVVVHGGCVHWPNDAGLPTRSALWAVSASASCSGVAPNATVLQQ
jgi:hypothetical protein